MSEAKEPATIV